MSEILEQLELNNTFFIQLSLFATLFVFLTQIYFRPFLKLFELRHKKMVADKLSAERLVEQANARFAEYTKKLNEERLLARQEYEALLVTTKTEEAAILNQAREDAKKITKEAAESSAQQREQLRRQLEVDVESIAQQISKTLLTSTTNKRSE